MIRTDAKNLLTEIQTAEKLRDNVLKASQEIRDVYVSQYYRADRKPNEPAPMNFPFEFLATTTPAIVYESPSVSVRSQASGVSRRVVKRLQHALNQWAQTDTVWNDLRLTWFDVAFSFGVIHTYLESATNNKGEDYFKICARRLDPSCYLMDARASHWTTVQWAGHAMTRDRDELLDNPAYDRGAVGRLAVDDSLEKAGVSTKDDLKRNEVLVYEVWVPGAKPVGVDPKLYHGMIYELGSTGEFLRAPRPFFGPEWGPYQFFGIYEVQNAAYPLSPIGAQWDQVVEYNRHAVGAARSSGRQKRILAYDATVEASAQRVRDASDGDVVGITGLGDNKLQQIDLGGASEAQLGYLDRLQAKIDRSYGMSDASRGVTTGKGTATEAADAASQRSARVDFMAVRYNEATEGVLYTAAWYMWNSQFVRMKLSPEAALDLNPRPKFLPPEEDAEAIAYKSGKSVEEVQGSLRWEPVEEFRGGEALHGNEFDFDDLMLKIDPFSMERANQPLLQRRMTEFVGLLKDISQIMPQTPFIDWRAVLEEYGSVFNRNDIQEFIRIDELKKAQDAESFKIQQEQAAQQMQAQATQAGNTIMGTPGVELAGNVAGQAMSAAQGVA